MSINIPFSLGETVFFMRDNRVRVEPIQSIRVFLTNDKTGKEKLEIKYNTSTSNNLSLEALFSNKIDLLKTI